jgi:O-antigen/teichoic acid export membrane protein
VVAFVATLLLAAFLEPDDFGIFFLVSAVVNLFVFLSDIGLAASLVQKKNSPTQGDLATTFSIQQILAVVIFILIVVLTPYWKTSIGLTMSGLYLLYALGFSFILASLKTIPSILLERELNFKGLVIPQIVENIVFYSIAVYLAWRGFGVDSYTAAVLFRGIAGVVAIYLIRPWRPKIGIYKKSLKGLLKFGVPFQINDLLARVKDDLLFVVIKKFITTAELGYLGWAKRWSLFPFRFSVDSIIRVTFPAYSRLQSNLDHLAKSIEKAMFFISLIIFPLLMGMAVMADPLVSVVESYNKWRPALPVLYLFIFDVAIASLVVPLTNALNAVGRIKTTLKLMSFWTTLIWLLSIPLTIKYGFIGVALATAGVSVSSLVTVLVVKKVVEIKVAGNVLPQLVAAGIMGMGLIYLQSFSSQTILNFVMTILVGAIIYLATVLALLNRRLISEIKGLIESRAKISG